MTDYSLKQADYTWQNALLWGNCRKHWEEAQKGSLCNRTVHAMITIAELLPIIGQIASIFEKIIVSQFIHPEPPYEPKPLNNEPLEKLKKREDEAQKRFEEQQKPFEEREKRHEKMLNRVKELEQDMKNIKIVKIEKKDNIAPPNLNAFQKVIDETSQFNGYKISLPQGHPCEGLVLTGTTVRPSNLFFKELFKDSGIETTLPGSGKLFAFNKPHKEIREYIQEKAKENPNGYVTVTAEKGTMDVYVNNKHLDVLQSDIYGNHVYRMSYQEILETLESQKIYTSSLLPLEFYKRMKEETIKAGLVTIPGDDANPILLKDLMNKKTPIGKLLLNVAQEPEKYGFKSAKDFQDMLEMTLYQIGSMVVKTEDYRIFTDGNEKILEREVGQKDAIRLINSCGIRGIYSPKTPQKYNEKIMTETFKAALFAAEKGIVVFPAVGMGVWSGDPDLYWKAFLDAIVQSNQNFDMICINPRHQKTNMGKYLGKAGEEFQEILDEYKKQYKDDGQIFEKLNKIHNLYDSQRDVVQLAHNFKKAFPDKIVSLFNAADPDVTLGNHVGEYVNNVPHTITTEENYTAKGTNGLCFEGITGVLEALARLIECA